VKKTKVSFDEKLQNLFSLDGAASLLDERDTGIINGMLTTNVTYRDVLSFRGLWAPPFFSSDFLFEIRLCGEKVPTKDYTWFPAELRRSGVLNGIKVSSELVLSAGRRTAVFAFTLESPVTQSVHLQFNIKGGLDYSKVWEFQCPQGTKPCQTSAKPGKLTKSNEIGSIVIAADIKKLVWEECSWHWDTKVTLPARKKQTFHVALAVGPNQEADRDCTVLMKNPDMAIKEARVQFCRRVAELFERLPVFEAKDKRLEKLYNRSLVHFLLNQWQVPEFKLHPYFSTGSINGGCVCSYLWDFGEAWELLCLYNPTALREHIKAFLSIDLSKHFAFLPMTGEAFGPWYYINQEKIIFHIYYYVLHTGDVDFLKEELNGRPIIDHVIEQALIGDDLSKPAVLVDYGSGNHHLELRKEYRYDNYLPDMNARRYAYYHAADTLCRLAGRQTVNLAERAEAIKTLVREKMWSENDKWFFYLDEQMQKHLRYTVQMYKVIDSPVLDPDQKKALISHLNEKEFLSDYGLHSMSKLDPAFDQVDIDNGGGGCCSCFLGTFIEKFYRAGLPKIAEDLLRRILWWGDRLPYWSDSLVANNMDYRKDTPLQNAIGAVSTAQGIIFGMFGVRVSPEGRITINPVPPSFSPEIKLRGLKLRGRTIDISVKGKKYTVTDNGRKHTSTIGRPIILEPTK